MILTKIGFDENRFQLKLDPPKINRTAEILGRGDPPKLILAENPILVEISISVENSTLSSTPVLQFTAAGFLLYFCGFPPNHFYSCAVTRERRGEVAACFGKGSKERLQPGVDLLIWGAGK